MTLIELEDLCSTKQRIPLEYRIDKIKARNLLKDIKNNDIKILNSDILILAAWAQVSLNKYNHKEKFSRVKEIKYVGKQPTYDLSINDGHSYVANGIYCHNTVNLPSTATSEEISEIYKLAYELGLKGVTVYRDGCKKNQPVTFKKEGLEVISNFERPSKLNATKHCIQLADGKLYVDVVKHENRIVELWLDYGKSGQEINGLLEALGKSLSTGVQHGVPKEAYIKQFENIKGDLPVWFKFEETDKKPVQLHSIPDALAKLLKRYYMDEEIVYNEPSGFETETCPKCQNKSIMNIEGCKTCQNCGFSKCS